MACDSPDVPPGGLWRGAGRGEEGRGAVRDTPVSRRVGSVTSPQRPAGPQGRGGTCRSAAAVMALGTWQPGPCLCRVCVVPSAVIRGRGPPRWLGTGRGTRLIPSRGLGTLKRLGQEGTQLWDGLGVKGGRSPGATIAVPSRRVSAGRASARGQELLAQVTAGDRDRDRRGRRTGGMQGAAPLGVWVPWGDTGVAFGHLGVTWAPWRVLAPGTELDTSPGRDQGTLG